MAKIFFGFEISPVLLDMNLTFGPWLNNFFLPVLNIPVVHCAMAVYVN